MKILMSGGYAPSLINFRGPLIKSMCQAGNEVIACAAERDELVANKLALWGVQYHSVGGARTSLNPIIDLLLFFRLYKLIRNLKPDLVISYTHKPVIYTTFAARIAYHHSRCFALITGLGYAFIEPQSWKKRLVNIILRSLYKICLRYLSYVFFQNPDDLKMFNQRKILPPNIPRQVIRGSGIDLKEFPAYPENKHKKKFLLIARLLYHKGIREFSEAAKIIKSEYPKTEFILVGPMDQHPSAIKKDELKKWTDSGTLKYNGWTQNVQRFYKECFAYVLPSYREGTPRTILEAMACARPVITTNTPGCRETVFPLQNGYKLESDIWQGVNGFLVPSKSVSSIVAAMRLLLKDYRLARKMGTEGRRLAEKYYDVHKVNKKILKNMGLI